jgi:mRNA interferase MazF
MKRSKVWLINLDPTVGAEIRKTRPAIIVNHDGLGILPLRVVVPITDWKDRYAVADWMVKVDPDTINNLTKPSAADCFQVRSVSQNRFVRKLGQMEDKKMAEIEQALTIILNIRK